MRADRGGARSPSGPGFARSPAAAFTLVEVMISSAIGALVLTGVMSALLMIGRTGFVASSYSELEAQTRTALDIFGEDVRKATDIRWNSAQSVTLFVATATNATPQVTYAYDDSTGNATSGCFYRMLGDASSTLPRRVLIRNVARDFTFQRFKLEQEGVENNFAATDLETKQIQVTLRATRTGATVVAANQAALSARYVLRNKRVSN